MATRTLSLWTRRTGALDQYVRVVPDGVFRVAVSFLRVPLCFCGAWLCKYRICATRFAGFISMRPCDPEQGAVIVEQGAGVAAAGRGVIFI